VAERAVGRGEIPLPSFRTPVRGYAFAAVPPPVGATLDVGAELSLLREPANPADVLAVGVWLTEAGEPRWRLGYLDRSVAARVAPRLDAGVEVRAVLDGWVSEPDGRWERPLVHVTLGPGPAAIVGAERVDPKRSLRRRPPGVRRRRVRTPRD